MEDKNKRREKMRKMVLAGDIGNVKNVAVTLRGKYRNGEDIRYYSLLDLGYKGKNLLVVDADDFGVKGSRGCETLERSLSLFVYEFMMAGNRDDTFYDDVMESLRDKKMWGKIYTCGVITSYSEGIDVSGFTKYPSKMLAWYTFEYPDIDNVNFVIPWYADTKDIFYSTRTFFGYPIIWYECVMGMKDDRLVGYESADLSNTEIEWVTSKDVIEKLKDIEMLEEIKRGTKNENI